MNKEELIKKVESIKNLKTDYKILYEVMDELDIKFKKTTCYKCRQDYLEIVKEELGMIESAAEVSEFNNETKWQWVYIRNRNYIWTKTDGTKVRICKDTPVEEIEEFVKKHKGYFKKIGK